MDQFEIKKVSSVLQYEYLSIYILWSFSNLAKNIYFLYIHNKSTELKIVNL